MGLRIRTNIAALNAQRRLSETSHSLNGNMARLASGKRINKSADDAAGLAVSTKMEANVRSLIQAKRNASDGVSVVQITEGGLEEQTNMLVRMRELSIQAATDTIAAPERKMIDQEFQQLKAEIDRIANVTEFNGTKLLIGDGELAPDSVKEGSNVMPLEIQVGPNYIPEVDGIENDHQVNVIKLDFSSQAFYGEALGIGIPNDEDSANTLTRGDATRSLNMVDEALFKVNDFRAYLGAMQNRLQSTISNLSIQVENISDARSRIIDADYAHEAAEYAQNNILHQGGVSVLGTAKALPEVALSLLR